MDALILRPHEGFGEGHYEVVHDGRHVGRIYLTSRYSGEGQSWYWGVNWFARPKGKRHLPGWDGTAGSKEDAMAAFRKAWDKQSGDGPPDDQAAD